jgi:hypothetical protein
MTPSNGPRGRSRQAEAVLAEQDVPSWSAAVEREGYLKDVRQVSEEPPAFLPIVSAAST